MVSFHWGSIFSKGRYSRVDDGREDCNSQILHADDIWRGGCRRATGLSHYNLGQCRIPGRANNAHGQSATNKEDSKSEINCLEGILDVNARAFGFRSDHGDILGSDHSKASGPQSSQETFKTAKSPSVKVFHKGAWRVPVSKPIHIMLGISTDHGDEGEEKQREDQDHLATREPKLGFTIGSDCQNVQEAGMRELARSICTAWRPAEGSRPIEVKHKCHKMRNAFQVHLEVAPVCVVCWNGDSYP